jgi:hypothetical protein
VLQGGNIGNYLGSIVHSTVRGTEISHGYNYPNDIKFFRRVLTVLARLYSLRIDEPVFKLLTPITATLTTFHVFVSVEQRQT